MTSQRTTGHFAPEDLDGLWSDHEYDVATYSEPAPSDATVAAVEQALGYRLPDAYVELARMPGGRNGGGLERCCYVLDHDDPSVSMEVQVTGLFAIGSAASCSLLGEFGSPFMIEEWGYPPIGVYLADTPSAGHDMLALDYRACGPTGEPTVVHVDQEGGYRITPVAPDLATFVRGLIAEEECHAGEDEARLENALDTVRHGTCSPVLVRALAATRDVLPDGEALVRTLAERIVREKGHFSLHADARSWLMYDALLWWYSALATATSFEDYFDRAEGQTDYGRPCHVLMMRESFVADPYGFRTGGYAEGFVRDWWEARVAAGAIVREGGGFRPSPDLVRATVDGLRAVATEG